MPLNELIKEVKRLYAPALALRRVMDRETRKRLESSLYIALAFLLFLAMIFMALDASEVGGMPALSILASLDLNVWGLFLLVFAAAFVVTALEAMHRSYYFMGLDNVLRETMDPKHTPVSWEVATIVAETDTSDILKGYLDSPYGQEILYRAGVTPESFADFYQKRTGKIDPNTFVLERDHGVVLSTYTRSLAKYDEEFVQFLNDHTINIEQLIEAAEWVTWIERDERRRARWWSRDNLGRIPGLGKTWSYGQTYRLEKYGHDLDEDHIWYSAIMTRNADEDEVEDMEKVLSRGRESNVLVIGDDMMTIRKRVAQLYHKIREGHALPTLEAKRVFIMDFELILSAYPNKPEFEGELREVLNQAVAAGNIVLYLEYLGTAINNAATLGVDLIDVLLPYLQSSGIQIVTAATRDSFYGRLQRDTRIMQAFDTVQMRDVSALALVSILRQRATAIEQKTGIVFSVPALEAIGQLADRYFPTGVMPDKAYDLIEELVPVAYDKQTKQLLKADVEELVSRKSGVPIGEVKPEERDKLMGLEDFLHQRVVGQDRAVSAVAKALRRSRAGVSGAERPMGSFLFLGPTGVGKTETCKALAEALFGDERMLQRLDMSEFQGPDALESLIGSYETGQPGRLATMIREKQYGVLLLDEFEKSAPPVHDLFLQILDEGHFTDASGKGVNARNLIIIATSNAGADLLWQWEKEKKNLAEMKRTLIDVVIQRGLYRPEFLNRFDDIVLFHVLQPDQVHQIAVLQLTAFKNRILRQHQIDITFTDDLVDYIAQVGYDPQFGGRPMGRAIKEQVEQKVADLMLTGDLRSGSHMTLSAADVQA